MTAFTALAGEQIHLRLANYDPTLPLVIDPVLYYSTLLGGSLSNSANEAGQGIAVDLTGQVFVTGYTYSSSFPTTADAFDPSYNGNEDAFIARLSENANQLLYSTFLGAENNEASYGVATSLARSSPPDRKLPYVL